MLLQRYCRGYLFSNTYHRKVQSVAVLQAGIRGLIARRNYNRLKIEVVIHRGTTGARGTCHFFQ